MPTYAVTVQGSETSRETTVIMASAFFTGDGWVTFWNSFEPGLPEPIVRFARETVVEISEKR